MKYFLLASTSILIATLSIRVDAAQLILNDESCVGPTNDVVVAVVRSDSAEVSVYDITVSNNFSKPVRNLLIGDGDEMEFRPDPELEYTVTGSPSGWSGENIQKIESIYAHFFWRTRARNYVNPGEILAGFQITVTGNSSGSPSLGNDGLPLTGKNLIGLPFQVDFRGGGCAWGRLLTK